MTGILVFGDNHLIVQGRQPDAQIARELVSHWSLIEIGKQIPPHLLEWQICTRELRQNLRWAIVMSGGASMNPAVSELLDELSARGVPIDSA